MNKHEYNILTTSRKYIAEQEYWTEKLSGEIPKTIFPYDNAASNKGKYKQGIFQFQLNDQISSKLNEMSNNSGTMLFMILASSLTGLIYKYTDNKDILIGTSIVKQAIEADFLNTVLLLRNQLNQEITFKELLLQMKETLVESTKHQNFPIENILEKLSGKELQNDFVDIIVLLENIHDRKDIQHLKENLLFLFNKNEGTIKCTIEYNTLKYHPKTISRLFEHLSTFLGKALFNVNTPLNQIEIITEEEEKKILYDFNDTCCDFQGDKTISQLFEEQVEKTPNHIAVICDGQQLTYLELNQKANQLATYLRHKGVKAESIVALMLERSFEMIVGILGILKAGGAYLPVSPDFPHKRVSYMLEDSKAHVVLTTKQFSDKFSLDGALILDTLLVELADAPSDNLGQMNAPDNLAYIIYTSGSTGLPKGVMIEHISVINRINWMQKEYQLEEKEVILHKTPFTFDVSVWEVFWWFFVGASVCLLPPGAEKEAARIVSEIEKNKATTLHFVPSMLNVFLEYIDNTVAADKLSSLRRVFASGEALPVQAAKKFNRLFKEINVHLHNLYGPTEATVDVTYFNCSDIEGLGTIPIGKPIDNTSLYVLGKNDELSPIGVAGELCISGVGVARGYINNKKLTSEKFVQIQWKDPLATEKLSKWVYRTGDLARWMPDGNIEYLGRMDHQVKIRGYRIELGEIENCILKHESINVAVVTAIEETEKDIYLCAYIVPSNNNFSVDILKKDLSLELPDYMIPSYFFSMDKIPLTSNGKVDRKLLPRPVKNEISNLKFEVPSDPVEYQLLNLWNEILPIDKISVNDDFFEVGGHSLKANILLAKIHRDFKVELPLSVVFKYPTIREQAKYLKDLKPESNLSAGPLKVIIKDNSLSKSTYPASSAQKRLFMLWELDRNSTSYNMPTAIQVKGKLNRAKLETSLKTIIERHEILRTSFHVMNGEFIQCVHDGENFKLEYRKADVEEISTIVESFIQPFDLNTSCLIRTGLIEIAENNYLLLVDFHHIVSDGISLTLFQKELMDLLEGQELAKLPIQYKDYSIWHNEFLQSETVHKMKLYWMNKLDDFTHINLPTKAALSVNKGTGAREQIEINEQVARKIETFCKVNKITKFVFLFAVFKMILLKITDQKDISVGVPVANRNYRHLEELIGVFLNVMVIRTKVDKNTSYINFINTIKNNVVEGYENQDYPYEQLFAEMKNNSNLESATLFSIMFNYMPYIEEGEHATELEFNYYPIEEVKPKYDVTLYVTEKPSTILLEIEYISDLYDKQMIGNVLGNFEHIAEKIIENKDEMLSQLYLMDDFEKHEESLNFDDQFENDEFLV